MKLLIQILQFFSSKLVSKIAYKFMSNPRIRKLRDSEEAILNKSLMEKIDYEDFKIQQYEWGKENDKTALLVHGWEGQAGNFAALIEILVNQGYHVVAYDAPSHGRSSIGKTNMFEFAEFLELQLIKLNPSLIISHSFGSVNAATVLRKNPNIKIDLWIMVTTPHKFITRVNDISNQFGINATTQNELINLIQNDTNENINQLDMAIYCKELTNVEKVIIVHSKIDRVLPIEGAREVAKSFKKSSLIELDNLGHYSILWSKELSSIIMENAH
ncbi:MAG: putative alpha/beta-fold hydrolase [Granulosicoccus sp.]|jgi:predicted alpha/beta-fold hydrolase